MYNTDRITVQTVQDVEPIIERVQGRTELSKGDFKYKASIPSTIVEELCRVYAGHWKIQPHQVLAELMTAKTKRAQRCWKMLTEGRDFR